MTDAAPLSIHRPDGDPKGGIVVLQEAFGVNDHIEDVTARFAAEGWLAVAPHLFHRSGDPAFGYDDIAQVFPVMGELTAEGILDDVDTALAALADAGFGPGGIGVVGFCLGGTIALVTASQRSVGAAVSFYGGGVVKGRFGFRPLIEEAADLQAPWLGLYGDLDQGIPVEEVEQLRTAATSSGQPTELVRYAEAAHGFHCDRRDSYHPASAADAWQRTLQWFDLHLTG